MVASYYRGQI